MNDQPSDERHELNPSSESISLIPGLTSSSSMGIVSLGGWVVVDVVVVDVVVVDVEVVDVEFVDVEVVDVEVVDVEFGVPAASEAVTAIEGPARVVVDAGESSTSGVVLDGAAVVGGSGWAVVAGIVVVATVVVGSSKAPAGTTISVASSGVSTTMRLVPAASPPVPQAVTASTEKHATTTFMQSINTPLQRSRSRGYREARRPPIVGQSRNRTAWKSRNGLNPVEVMGIEPTTSTLRT